MTAQEFETLIVEWARRQDDIEALVLGGSRAEATGSDSWSDWDFQLITSRPRDYYKTEWLHEIAPCWCAHVEWTSRGVMKVSAVFVDGLEVDFVLLIAWQMKLVFAGMRRPQWMIWMPGKLRRGIYETRAFMLGSGYRLLVGSESWTRRFTALQKPWPQVGLSAEEFARHSAAFWPKAVWICKKILRPEPRSAMHWLHLLVVNHVYPILAEEARLEGRTSRPEARKAEQWLGASRLEQTAIRTSPEQAQLAAALLAELALFQDVTQCVATWRKFEVPDYSAVAQWLTTKLVKVTSISSPPKGIRG